MYSLIFISFVLCLLIDGALACGMGGISSGTGVAVLALCVVAQPAIYAAGAIKTGFQKSTKKITKQIREKKRNSDVIKTQVNRALKRIGKDKFQQHVQELFDRVKQQQTSTACFDLGVALFLSRDLLGAEEYLSKAISLNDNGFGFRAHAFFVRGMTRQYLFDFKHAIEDFKYSAELFESNPLESESGGADAPRLNVMDAINSYGFATALEALYHTTDAQVKEQQLTFAIGQYTTALDRSGLDQGMWFYNRGVARYFRSYVLQNATPAVVENELTLALADFTRAVNSGNFGTAADGYAMLAQTLARLKRPRDEVLAAVEQAYDADSKVFMIDVTSESELSTPWPLPRYEYPFKKSSHSFEQVHFSKPTWCNHCMEFIQNPIGKQGYECTKCQYKVHSKCFPQVKSKSCWNDAAETQTTKSETATVTHTHHFKLAQFHKPTWCSHCSKFIVGIKKQGYRCSDCLASVHKDCAAAAGGYIDE